MASVFFLAAMLEFQSTSYSSNFTCGAGGVVCQAPTSCSPTPANFLHSGCTYAQLNGFSSSGNQYVTMESGVGVPPTAPGVNSSAYWVTARVNQSVPQLFSAVLGNPSGLVSARATAALNPAKDCVWVMDPNSSGALSMSGTPSLTVACGVFINSNNATALSGSGTPTLHASEIDVVGGYSFGGSLVPNPPSTGVPPRSDPLANLPAPSVGPGCDYTNYSVNGWATPILSPGIYCGGITVGNGTATLSPGIYILKGGAISTQNANSTLIGNNVFIYNTYDGTHPYTGFSLSANSNVTLTAPVTGTYAGILIMEDRSITTTTCGGSICADTFGGGSAARYTGVVYGPKSAMSFYGNASLTAYTEIISYRIQMVGTTSINDDYSSLPTGNPIKVTALVE